MEFGLKLTRKQYEYHITSLEWPLAEQNLYINLLQYVKDIPKVHTIVFFII